MDESPGLEGDRIRAMQVESLGDNRVITRFCRLVQVVNTETGFTAKTPRGVARGASGARGLGKWCEAAFFGG